MRSLIYAPRHNALVAQLDRVLGYEPSGRRFESSRVRHIEKSHQGKLGGIFSFGRSILTALLLQNPFHGQHRTTSWYMISILMRRLRSAWAAILGSNIQPSYAPDAFKCRDNSLSW